MTSESASFLTLCLQSKQGRKVVSMKSTASTEDLYQRATMEFGGTTVSSLKGGFPPKPIPNDATTVLSSLLSNQERITVELQEASTTKGKKKQNTSTAPSAANDSSPRKKSKRAAAKAATESMPAMIKAQDKMMKETAAGSKKRARPNGGGSAVQRKSPSKPQIAASAGAGRRLNDGAVVANPRAAGRRKGSSNNQQPPTDLGEALMGALHDKGQMGTILRKGMKNAVQASYETSKAFSRLAAIQGKQYEIRAGGNTASAAGGTRHVTFHGSVDKQKVEETVDCIPQDVLKAVLEGIYASDKEAVRPENLARLSPRVLWSCVYYYPNDTSLDSMYPQLLPDLDWSFLRRRAQQLSEKALENKRQEEEEERCRNGETDAMDMDQAANAVAAVEHAMEHLHEYQTEERKARSAQAALARLQQQQNGEEQATVWELTTPKEPDRDELRECIERSQGEDDTASSTTIAKWITQLMKECGVHNWRELANVSDASAIANKLQVPEAKVKAWMDYAQSESVGEIIVEICDDNVEAVELLTSRARSGTPKDLAAWRSIPDVLLEQLQNQEENGKRPEWMQLATIKTWCDRSFQLLGEVNWLNWYATPVE